MTDQEPTMDTSAQAEAVWLQCIRELSPRERLRKGCGMSQRGRRHAMDAIRRQHPDAHETDVRLRYIELAYEPDLAADVRCWLGERQQ